LEHVGIFASIYGSRGVAELLKMFSSPNYSPTFYIVAKQNNPMLRRLVKVTGGVLRVDRSLKLSTHIDLLEKYHGEIDLAICPHEKIVIAGLRDAIEERGWNIPCTFPRKIFAIERSKILQRRLFPEDYNPRWKAFHPSKYSSRGELLEDVKRWVEMLGGAGNVVFKPDSPAAGKGVAVGGEHFHTLNELIEGYISSFNQPFIIEERVEAEESSCQIWFDGSIGHLNFLRYPEIRDYKRAFEGDLGPNTGGMGCYMDSKPILPFMFEEDWSSGYELASKLIRNMQSWAEENDLNPEGMYPCMYYLAMAHPHRVFEGNIGRPGDPEDIPPLLTMKNDLIDFYFGLVEGNPPNLNFEEKASVLIYVVPPTYGGRMSGKFNIKLNFEGLWILDQNNPVYLPGDIELSDGAVYVKTSRSVAVVGLGESIEDARRLALRGVELVEDSAEPKGYLWHRGDIASKEHIEKSVDHRRRLA